jgi:trigger factor
VRVDVALEPDTVQRQVERTAIELGRDLRVPGFRRGKVPSNLVLQRMGREAVLEQALRDSLPGWYERALMDSGVAPVGDPKLDVPSLPAEGEELSFSFEVAVRPPAKLGDYRGLEVGRPEPEVPEEAVSAELDRLREALASLNPVDRPAQAGDLVMVDFVGTVEGEPFEGGEARDLMVELGDAGLLPEMDEALIGAEAGRQLTVDVTFPDDQRPEEIAGKQGNFAITVKEVREKTLPELDDDFASEASEFETLEELRAEIESRVAAALEQRADADFREAAVDAAAVAAEVELPKEVVHARAHEMFERFQRSLASRGVSIDSYLQMSGKSSEEVVTEAEGDAEKALRREATLDAIADAEGIEVTDDDLIAALGPGEGDSAPEAILARLREGGRDALLRQEVRMRKAADLVVESATPIPVEQAAARDALWTPEKEREEAGAGGLWTPGAE